MITGLKPEQIARQKEIADKWIALAMSGKYDPAKTEAGVRFMYELSNLPAPKNIFHVNSHLEACVLIQVLKQENVGENVGENVWANVRENVWENVGENVWENVGANVRENVWENVRENVRANVGANVWANVGENVGENVGANVWENVWENVRANVGANVWENVRANVGANVRANVWENVGENVRENVRANVWAVCPYFNYSDFSWTAHFDYYSDFLFATGEQWERFNKWKAALGGCPFETYVYENVAIVVRPPTAIIRNENGRLHNTRGAAVVFGDGYSQHYINGRFCPSDVFAAASTGKVTKDMLLQEKNAEIRAFMYAILGQKKVFDLIGAGEICRKDANNETYILYRTKEPVREKHWQWVGVTCPSTGTKYLLGVPDTVTCPLEGAAGTWGLTATEYKINQHT